MIKRLAARTVMLLRDGWLIVGISVALLAGLELLYRGQANLRRELRETVVVPESHPNASEQWWREWVQGEGSWRNRYDPYRARWPERNVGTYLNIDSLGRRRTVQANIPPAGPRQRIFLFGGSTMFGYTVRDEWTIASQLASLLADAGIEGVEIVNLAQSTFNITQGLITLNLELRDGNVPDVVVFLDGNNDVAPVFQGGAPGSILNQELIGRALERTGEPPSLGEQLVNTLQLVKRLQRLTQEEATAPPPPDRDTMCTGVVDTYLGSISVVEALGSSFDFTPFFFWQPMLAITQKELTGWEQSRISSEAWQAAIKRCTEMVIAQAHRREVDSFASLGALFDDHRETVFIDDFGHVTEAGNRQIAEAISARLLPVLVGES